MWLFLTGLFAIDLGSGCMTNIANI